MNIALIISIVFSLMTLAGSFAIIKYNSKRHEKYIEKLFEKFDVHNLKISALEAQKLQYLTSEKMDVAYLRRKEFEQFEKHIDMQFESIHNGQKQILDAIKERG